MSQYLTGNLLLLQAILCTAVSQLVFKAVLNETGPLELKWSFLTEIAVGVRAWRLAAGGVLLVAGFLFWIASLSRLDLSYAYPMACSSTLLVTLLGFFFLCKAAGNCVDEGTSRGAELPGRPVGAGRRRTRGSGRVDGAAEVRRVRD